MFLTQMRPPNEGPAELVFRLARRVDSGIERWVSRRSVIRARVSHAEVRWVCSPRMTWIATLSDRFVGIVEEVDGTYVANDTIRGTYNTYRTLPEAMAAFESPMRSG